MAKHKITRVTIAPKKQISVTELGYLSRGKMDTFGTAFVDCLNLADFYQSCSALMAEIKSNPFANVADLFDTYFGVSHSAGSLKITNYGKNKSIYSALGVSITTESI